MDWAKVFGVAATGVISVFLALGILNLAVSFTGYLFKKAGKEKAKQAV